MRLQLLWVLLVVTSALRSKCTAQCAQLCRERTDQDRAANAQCELWCIKDAPALAALKVLPGFDWEALPATPINMKLIVDCEAEQSHNEDMFLVKFVVALCALLAAVLWYTYTR